MDAKYSKPVSLFEPEASRDPVFLPFHPWQEWSWCLGEQEFQLPCLHSDRLQLYAALDGAHEGEAQ